MAGVLAILIWAGKADSAMTDCIDATCRVKTAPDNGGRYSMGTGVVFEISNGKVHVLTNAHVATTAKMKLEFWRDGHKMNSVPGVTVLRDKRRDVAVISIDVAAFSDNLPTVIPLAPRDTVLLDGQEVTSAGCPRGEWTKAWIGHVENSLDGRIAFQPGPFGGQSGSAIFDADGTQIVALLNLQELNSRDEIIRGYAVSLENIYAAIYGEAVEKDVNYWKRQRSWPFTPKPSQCGPKGCPRPEKYGGKKGVPVPRMDSGDLRPDVPFVLPEIIVPEVEVAPLSDGALGVEPLPADLADAIQGSEAKNIKLAPRAWWTFAVAVVTAAFLITILLTSAGYLAKDK